MRIARIAEALVLAAAAVAGGDAALGTDDGLVPAIETFTLEAAK